MDRVKSEAERFLAKHRALIEVRLTKVSGSSPREAGTTMLVSGDEELWTIGGGQLEYLAMDRARQMLNSDEAQAFMDVPLGPEIGQCCGGRVELLLTRIGATERGEIVALLDEERRNRPHVFIMGAGHVGRALADQFQHLPVRTILVDVRSEELQRCQAEVETRELALPEVAIETAPSGSAFIVATHDHGLDFLITMAALQRRDAAYVGLIGSATKRAKFKSWLAAQAPELSVENLICPIGANGSGDKRPAVIAAFVVAETLQSLAAGAARPQLCKSTTGGSSSRRSLAANRRSERGALPSAFQTGGVSYDWRQL